MTNTTLKIPSKLITLTTFVDHEPVDAEIDFIEFRKIINNKLASDLDNVKIHDLHKSVTLELFISKIGMFEKDVSYKLASMKSNQRDDYLISIYNDIVVYSTGRIKIDIPNPS